MRVRDESDASLGLPAHGGYSTMSLPEPLDERDRRAVRLADWNFASVAIAS